MWVILGIVLLVAWIFGFLVFHVAGFFIHLLIILAVLCFIMQFVFSSRKSA